MMFQHILLLAAAGLQQAHALQLDVTSTASIRNASTTYAYGLMSWYKNNASGTAETAIGTLPAPLYWWEAGAVWGGMIDYWAYTNDTSYNPTVTQALLAQVGPDNNYMPPAYYQSLGNDDQGFWALAVLSAVEYGYPEGPDGSPTWLSLAEAVFNTMVPRWDLTSCGGGLKWQIFTSNAGYDYKNSISNGAFFQIAARLAHYTGNSTYYDWAEKVWDWTISVGLIDPQSYQIFDGTNDLLNCTSLDHVMWTYNSGMFLYGTAVLYNYTNASSIWSDRTTKLLEAANTTFFSPYANASNVMFESACEPANTCDDDQYSFKAYLARWLAKASVVAPFTAPAIKTLLQASAQAAALACSGGDDGTTCGQKWYTGGYDGVYGVGQELSALEVTQALLIADAPALLKGKDVYIEPAPTSTLNANPSASATSTAAVSAASASASKASTGKDASSAISEKWSGRHGIKACFAAAIGVAIARV